MEGASEGHVRLAEKALLAPHVCQPDADPRLVLAARAMAMLFDFCAKHQHTDDGKKKKKCDLLGSVKTG